MSERTLTLTADDLARFQLGVAVVVADSDGATVAVYPEATAFLDFPTTDRRLCLRDREADDISRGDTWVVSDVRDRRYAWTVRLAGAAS
ncbi:hypothetical protein AB0F72_08710 [Actinoplanes sp. NPDC023936]|uniref:hypothetical protein n=1 Tax=Actinoplanes sp. NPDC023936 TaxID=3154910 RepID=UPI0033E21334